MDKFVRIYRSTKKHIMKKLTLLILLILFCTPVSAQYGVFDEIVDSTAYKDFENPLRFDDRQVINPTTEPDSADVKRLEHKAFWRRRPKPPASTSAFGLSTDMCKKAIMPIFPGIP